MSVPHQQECQAKCKMLVNSKEAWDLIMETWGSVIDYTHVDSIESCLNILKVFVSHDPYLLNM